MIELEEIAYLELEYIQSKFIIAINRAYTQVENTKYAHHFENDSV